MTKTDATIEKAHAQLGASAAERWMNCPASIRLSRGIPNVRTEYSDEGTTAHAVLEMALKRSLPPETWIDTLIPETGMIVTDEMCEAVQACLDEVARLKIEFPDIVMFVERKFSLEALNPPGPMFGTADIILWSKKARRLWVIDYKHGQGYAVTAKKNPQLRYYGLGAIIALEKEVGPGDIDTVTLTIVQPRAPHSEGTIRSETITYDEVADFADDLLDAARKALADESAPKAGGWCRWCRASPICPAQHNLAAATAQTDFMDIDAPASPEPATLPIETLLKILDAKPRIEAWLKSVYNYVFAELQAGRPVPGHKLVGNRATRKWSVDEKAVIKRLYEVGLTDTDIKKEAPLKSPTQIEALKQIGKPGMIQFADLVEKKSTGLLLVPESDSRPAASAGALAEFTEE